MLENYFTLRLVRKMKSRKIHDYEIAEISYYEIKGGNMEFWHWIDQNNLK